MSKGVTASGIEYTVTHEFANGVELDDNTGVFVPVTKETEISYQIMKNLMLRYAEECAKKERDAQQATNLPT